MAKKKKVRVEMRKNRSKPPRPQQWTRGYQEHGFAEDATVQDERIRAKGDLSRRRTVIQDESPAEASSMPAVDETAARPGRVLRVHGLYSVVETEDGRQFRCVVRRVLRTLATDERNIVTTGDRVWFLPAGPVVKAEVVEGGTDAATVEGVIERVEPRHGILTRASRGREHVQVANVDQVVFVL
jgi:ribosome biogenesis GTPase